MEKGQEFNAAPLPTAPPSYQEAVSFSGHSAHTAMHQLPNAPITTPPYPVADPQMPMPSAQPIMQMPMPTHQSATQHNYAPQESFSQPQQEIRIVHQHVNTAVGPTPVKMMCPSCRANIKTTTVSDHKPSAHICCIILCIIGCCLCSCLPYCMNSFRSVHHFCPNCKAYIGTWKG